MMYFSKKQIEDLRPYETHFHSCIELKCKRATSAKDNEFVKDIYERATYERITLNNACGTCVYNLFLKVGKLYYASIKHYENDVEVEKPKRGRPKKVTE